MPTQQEFQDAIEKELNDMLKRTNEIELALVMNKQSIVTIADLFVRMKEEVAIPEGYEKQDNVVEVLGATLLNCSVVEKSNVSGTHFINPEPKTYPLGIEDRSESEPVRPIPTGDNRKVTVLPPIDPRGKMNRLSSASGLLEDLVLDMFSHYTSPVIPVPLHSDSKRARRGPIGIRFDLPEIYEELHNMDKPMDREMDLHLNVMEWTTAEPIIILEKRPSGFYCFTDRKDYKDKDFVLSVRAPKGIALLTFNMTSNKTPALEIFGEITQEEINDKFIELLLTGFQNTLARLANYALESPASRKSRLHVHHMCSLS